MDYTINMLRCVSSDAWIKTVMDDFDSFLQDHADCERKASAMAMSFIARYPDRVEIIPKLIDTAVEELQHFRQVYKIMERRRVALAKEMRKDPYVKPLVDACRSSTMERFLDRLVLASIVEWRGCERFRMISEALETQELKVFYANLYESEARHGEIFLEMAQLYFPQKDVDARLDYLLDREAAILQGLELRAALH